MQKRKLRIDDLRIESFDTGQAEAERGTVRARMTGPTACDPDTCETRYQSCTVCEYSCWGTCIPDDTCGLSCDGSCWNTCNCA
ncbi:MAG TPA: hypothetical protein VF771_06355 [Longimicrobiaceae bacterium]